MHIDIGASDDCDLLHNRALIAASLIEHARVALAAANGSSALNYCKQALSLDPANPDACS